MILDEDPRVLALLPDLRPVFSLVYQYMVLSHDVTSLLDRRRMYYREQYVQQKRSFIADSGTQLSMPSR